MKKIWIFWFAVYALLLFTSCLLTINIALPDLEFILSGLISTALFVGTSYCLALGLNKRLFSKKATKIFNISLIVAIFIFSTYVAFISSVSLLVENGIYGKGAYLTSLLISEAVSLGIYYLLFLPIIVALTKYVKNYESLTDTKKPFMKIFALFCVIPLLAAVVKTILIHYKSIVDYNIFDYLCILSCIYEIIFISAYAFSKKVLNQLFWKISSVFYIASLCTFPLCTSLFLKHLGIDAITSISSIICCALLMLAFLYILYRYGFTDEVFEKSNTIEENG